MEDLEMSGKSKGGSSFGSMGLEKDLLAGLNRMGYTAPTPVQRKALPIALGGMDMVCMARTGSGKTCVFLLPMIHKVKCHQTNVGVRAVILSPTRELAVQTFRFAKDMAKFTDIRIISIVGGDPIEAQFEALASHPDIIVATPGRLMHHIREISTFKLKACTYLVFDEADRLFEMGFAEQLNEIVRECPEERQTLLFSATMPKQLIQFSRAGLRDPQLVRLETDAKMSDELRIANFAVRSNEKISALLYLVRTIIPPDQMTIVFTATRHHSEFIHALFNRIGVTSTLVYGTMDQDARSTNLKAFRQGQVSYLIVTDLAARGIDVPLLNNVINLHFPPSPKLFVHRCGRAARQGRTGFALSIVEPEEMAFLADVHTFLGQRITTVDDIRAQGSDADQASLAYTLQTMRPEWVHTGLLPQDVLDEENDFLRRALADDDNLQSLARIGDNGMKQYRRTRSEASREGVTIAKRLSKGNSIKSIHPLIAGCDPKRCTSLVTDKQAYVRMLQTFRPAQTVFESGIGTGTASHVIKGKRKKGSVEAHGVEVMRQLRRMVAPALERNKVTKIITGTDSASGNSGENVTLSTWEQLEAEDNSNWQSGWDEIEGADAEAERSGSSSTSEQQNRKGTRRPREDDDDGTERAKPAAAITEENNGGDSEEKEKPRLSIAERKRLKRAGHSQSDIAELALRRAEQSRTIANATSKQGGGGNPHSQGRTLTEATLAGAPMGRFMDPKHYMVYGTEDEARNFAEAQLQPMSGLKTADALQAQALESAMLDVAPDDAVEMNKKRRVMRWDAKKRKFVKQSIEEISQLKSTAKRSRAEGGNGPQTSKLAQGEMYNKWKKRTRREVSAPGQAPDHDDDRPMPNVKVNRHVKDELKDINTLRKARKVKDNLKLKNMTKDKRRKVEGAAKKKKALEQSQALRGRTKAGSRKVKAILRM